LHGIERALAQHQVEQRLSMQELHGDEGHAAHATEIEHTHDTRMADARDGPGLQEQALRRALVVGALGIEANQLHRQRRVEHAIVSAEHGAHRAHADQLQELVTLSYDVARAEARRRARPLQTLSGIVVTGQSPILRSSRTYGRWRCRLRRSHARDPPNPRKHQGARVCDKTDALVTASTRTCVGAHVYGAAGFR
jgi:hypothetical protein